GRGLSRHGSIMREKTVHRLTGFLHGLRTPSRREDAPVIDIEEDAGITTLTLNHGKVNAVDVELLEAIAEQLAAMAADPAAPPVIITGAGRAFSAGVDLVRFLDDGADYARRLVPAISGAVTAVLAYPAP